MAPPWHSTIFSRARSQVKAFLLWLPSSLREGASSSVVSIVLGEILFTPLYHLLIIYRSVAVHITRHLKLVPSIFLKIKT